MASWIKEEIKISAGTKVLAQTPVIVQRYAACRVGGEVSLNGSLAAFTFAQDSLMNGAFKGKTR